MSTSWLSLAQLPHDFASRAARASTPRLALALVLIAAAVGCSEDKKTGGLTVVVESDLSMPKDIDRVRFEVSQDGLTLRTEDHLLGEGQLLMPAEFQIKPVGNSNPVLIRALAFKGGIARIERSVITTVPSTFVAMVRLPLTYLCAGTAREDGTSTCGEAQTCKLGVCQSAVVDAATLPVYQPGPWTGSESGQRDPTANDCFDVLNCFSQAYRVDLDRNTCTFVIDNDDPANISVGIKLPQGSDGICGAGSCWIALDAGAEGWTVEGTIFKLPDALCRDQSDGSRLVIVASNMCGGKTLNTPTCGTWSAATHPIDTSETIGTGTSEDGVEQTPGSPVGLSCAGLSYQPCGDCGQQRRTCMNGKWGEWGECLGQGVCSPNQSEMCGSDGMRVCMNTCDWDDCAGQTCAGNAVEACGNCGTRRRTCNNGEWSPWGECENSGQCAPGATQPCGSGGTQACMGNCQWGECGTQVCLGAPSQACGNCGTQTRTCNADTMQWSEFGACAQEGECEANQTRTCGLRGMQACGGNCQWDASCTGQVCEGPASRQCGNCGIQTRTCDSNTGQWSAWSKCMSEGVCTPGATIGCGVGGTRECLSSCYWSEECSGQICSGPMTESCGNCGTRSRECDGTTATWRPWGPCTNTGPCSPGATRRCGSGGTQTCTDSCQWSRQCLGQSCAGEATRECGDCGTQSRSCNGSTGQYGDWGQCVNQGPCTPGEIVSCGALKERVCQDSCRFDQCHCVAGATECGDACVDLRNDPNHCGACDTSCNGLACKDGVCEKCPSGQHNCNGECVSNTSPNSCGLTSCTPCPAPANATATCEAASCDFKCNPGFHRCGDACFSNLLDNYCGDRCNTPCPPPVGGTARCEMGTCVQQCPSGGSTGTNTNCSGCGDECMDGERCIGGMCSCPGGGHVGTNDHCASCGDRCLNRTECMQGECLCANGKPLGDDANCGMCDRGCPDGETCRNGTTCGCEDGELGDDRNCGRCGTRCPEGQVCKGSTCGCADGDLGDDNNCGSCGNKCGRGLTCKGTSCGCESGTLGDINNCGSCGNRCIAPPNSSPKCTATGCDFECDRGYHRCGDACFSNNVDGYCGSRCDQKCPATHGGTPMCSEGMCVEVCSSGGMIGTDTDCLECGDRCEFGTECRTGGCLCDDGGRVGTKQNCAACGDRCTNSTECVNGRCECSNGVLGDDKNCGSCGNACTNGERCEGGTTCACADGNLGDDNNCGACGRACRNGERCNNQGSCSCPRGSLNDVNNCGTCGTVCPGEKPSCNGGQCGCAADTCGSLCEVCDPDETCGDTGCIPKTEPEAGQGGMNSGGNPGSGGQMGGRNGGSSGQGSSGQSGNGQGSSGQGSSGQSGNGQGSSGEGGSGEGGQSGSSGEGSSGEGGGMSSGGSSSSGGSDSGGQSGNSGEGGSSSSGGSDSGGQSGGGASEGEDDNASTAGDDQSEDDEA